MATTLLRVDGGPEEITPANGVHWSLEELQKLVGGYIEVVRTRDAAWLVVDEEGLLKNYIINVRASLVAGRRIVGDAVHITTFLELNGPEEVQ